MDGKIHGIDGPVIKVRNTDGLDFGMSEMLYIGEERLMGEVISVTKEFITAQVFEDTTGLRPGDVVRGIGRPLSAPLGPGIIGNIFDGIMRPLRSVQEKSGAFIGKGFGELARIGSEHTWPAAMRVKEGDKADEGMVIAEIQETPVITHRVMIPNGVSGVFAKVVPDGEYSISDVLAVVEDERGNRTDITMTQDWPIRKPRPSYHKKPADRPLITGQRVIDALFPIARGGTAAIPGGFGTGKTMTQHQLAKWSDADIIVYIGCGERGNEMTQVLEDFAGLKDPRTGRLLMDRTVLIANTSNMPVAAREASIYTGITIAEYYRDMGYHVAIMADSTSRWAEALRELSGRLEEMPAEEGFPAYLASRLAAFYERAGVAENHSGTEGSVSIIGAVSPQGGDFSEPVTQNTKRFVRCFWTLDRSLSYARHFPAIQWMTSYSEYLDDLKPWYDSNVGQGFLDFRAEIMRLLTQESELMDIVKLIGSDVLPDEQKLVLEISRVIRIGFIQQNAYHSFDTYVPLLKQMKMMEIILFLFERCKKLVAMGRPVSVLRSDGIFERLIQIKYEVPNDELEKIDAYKDEIEAFYQKFVEYA